MFHIYSTLNSGMEKKCLKFTCFNHSLFHLDDVTFSLVQEYLFHCQDSWPLKTCPVIVSILHEDNSTWVISQAKPVGPWSVVVNTNVLTICGCSFQTELKTIWRQWTLLFSIKCVGCFSLFFFFYLESDDISSACAQDRRGSLPVQILQSRDIWTTCPWTGATGATGVRTLLYTLILYTLFRCLLSTHFAGLDWKCINLPICLLFL